MFLECNPRGTCLPLGYEARFQDSKILKANTSEKLSDWI